MNVCVRGNEGGDRRVSKEDDIQKEESVLKELKKPERTL
jgi:hypothetical protein